MKTGADRVFIDTNILVYASVTETEFHSMALSVLDHLQAKGAEFCISNQNLREFIACTTRPGVMSDPLPKLEALNLAGNYRAQLDILPEDDGVMSRLLTLLQEVDCAGRQVFDANLVATMLEGGVSTLLTANTKHFRRFQSFIELLDMKTVAAEA